MMAAMQRLREWWRAPERRGNTMVLLLKVTLLELLDQRKLMTNVTQGMQDLEGAVDALSLKLATTQGAVSDIASVATESAETLRALAVAVNELKSDAVPADFALVVERVKQKAASALVTADSIIAQAGAIKDALAVAEDEADDAIAPAPVAPPVETVVVGEGEAEPVPAPVEDPVAVEPAVPAEGAGDVVAVEGEVPAVEPAPAPAEGEVPAA